MATTEAIIAHTQSRVDAIMQKAFPDAIPFDNGAYVITHGSSSVMIMVRPYTETDTMVELLSQVVTGATVTPELMHFLLRKNAELHFGAFSLLFDGTIVFSYSLPGTSIDANELEAAVTSVAVIADHYDDHIVQMAGGKRHADLG
ncbi:MAG: YbjN domain-containing protein [Bacteroidetes bacterium]|nr:YbjN domain-containing protein [Bacteroidota bacterium]